MDAPSAETERLRRMLGAELRRLRTEQNLSGQRIAQLAAMSQSKLSKIESGKFNVSDADIKALLEALKTEPGQQELVTEYFNKIKALSLPIGLEDIQIGMMQEELVTTAFRSNASIVIPGLLQTAAYSRRLFNDKWPLGVLTPEEINRRVVRRSQRQALLADTNRNFRFAIAKAATTAGRNWHRSARKNRLLSSRAKY